MKKKCLLVLLCAALLTGCGPDSGDARFSPEIKAEMAELAAAVKSSSDKKLVVRGYAVPLSEDEWTELTEVLKSLSETQLVLPKEKGAQRDLMNIAVGEARHTIERFSGERGCYISIDNAEYYCSDDIGRLFDKYCSNDEYEAPAVTQESPADRLIGLSAECPEPTTKDEYIEAARSVTAQWLNSLKYEQDAYNLEDYTFKHINDTREFQGDGFVNGGREFVCFVAFDATLNSGNSVFNEIGSYDKFYHLYFGPGVLARFRWEDGICTLIDYDDAYELLNSDRLTDGLYGINAESDSGYKTFYDFLNDKDAVESWVDRLPGNYVCYYTCSRNAVMIPSGNIICIEIGDNTKFERTGEYVTSTMCRYFSDKHTCRGYNSPVDYISGSGAVVMTYRDGFSLVFDDYNHDGIPDYTIKISSDENGSTYYVQCLDANGMPFEDEYRLYIPGEFSDSVRLQISDSDNLLVPRRNESGGISYEELSMFADESNTVHTDVTETDITDYRMYSQRFYMPESLRNYSSTDDEVIFYFWNNTAADVAVGGDYEIQRRMGDQWEYVVSGKTLPQAEASAGKCTELCFDVSDITSEELAVYRIKLDVNGKTVYGGFYMGSRASADIVISADEYPSGSRRIGFELKNTGMSAVYPESIELYRDNEKVCEINTDTIGRINSGVSENVFVTDDEISGGITTGEYILKVVADGKEFTGTATVIEVPHEQLFYFPETVAAEKVDGALTLKLENGIWNKETAMISGSVNVQVMKNGAWYDTIYEEKVSDDTEVKYGETIELELVDQSAYLLQLRVYYDAIRSSEYSYFGDEEMMNELKNMSFEEFLRDTLGIAEAANGDLCRLILYVNGKTEYVYFYMP